MVLFEVAGNYATNIIKIKILHVSELRFKFTSYELPVLNPHLPKDQERLLDVLSHCILVFYTFFATIFPSNHFTFPAKHLTITAPKISCACSYKPGSRFWLLCTASEELYPVHISNSEADSWNMLLNSLRNLWSSLTACTQEPSIR